MQAYSFDKGLYGSPFELFQLIILGKAREIKRKQYASELFHLTAAEIAEEEALYIEVKRIEQNERRHQADRDDLMRTVMGLDSGFVDIEHPNIETILGVDKVSAVVLNPSSHPIFRRRRGSDRKTMIFLETLALHHSQRNGKRSLLHLVSPHL